MINQIHSVDYLVDMPNVKLNIQDDGKIAWLANFTLDSYKEIRWHLSHPLSKDKVTVIKRKGKSFICKMLSIKVENNIATISTKLNPLETIQLLF